jgi:hypothetical protein
MELFRRHGEAQRFLIMKENVIHAYLVYNATEIKKQLARISLLIMKMSGKVTYETDSTHCINKAILRSESNDFDLTSEVINSLDGQIKISAYPILSRPSAKIYFSVEFKVIPTIFLFIS